MSNPTSHRCGDSGGITVVGKPCKVFCVSGSRCARHAAQATTPVDSPAETTTEIPIIPSSSPTVKSNISASTFHDFSSNVESPKNSTPIFQPSSNHSPTNQDPNVATSSPFSAPFHSLSNLFPVSPIVDEPDSNNSASPIATPETPKEVEILKPHLPQSTLDSMAKWSNQIRTRIDDQISLNNQQSDVNNQNWNDLHLHMVQQTIDNEDAKGVLAELQVTMSSRFALIEERLTLVILLIRAMTHSFFKLS